MSNRTVDQFQHDTRVAYDFAARAAAARRGELGWDALLTALRFDYEEACKAGNGVEAARIQKEGRALLLDMIEAGLVD